MAADAANVRRLAARARRGRSSAAAGIDPAAWAWLTGAGVSSAGRRATREEALGYPFFERCLDGIAASVASVDIQAGRFDKATGTWRRLTDQPTFLGQPDPSTDAWQWRYAAVRDLQEYGNHVALLGDMDWRTMRPGWVVPLPAEDVGLVEVPEEGRWWFTFGPLRLDPSQVLHISRGNRSGEVLGRGLLDRFGRSLRTAVTAEEWAGRYLDGGGVPPAVIKPRVSPGKEGADKFKDDWRRLMATGEAILLPPDVDVVPLVSDAQKQQLVEARQWNAQMACAMTGFPSHMLGLPGPSMTYQNVETADIAYRAYTLDRYAQPIRHAIDRMLLPGGVSCRFMWGQLDRTDEKSRVDAVAAKLAAGIVTVDEARQELGYMPLGTETEEGQTGEGAPELGMEGAAL